MRIGGTLSKWNDARGFGFITPARGGPDVFVHISEFPKESAPPQTGEKLTFEVVTDDKGKTRAINLSCPQRPASASAPIHDAKVRRSTKSTLLNWLLPLFLVFLAIYGYSGHDADNTPRSTVAGSKTSAHAAHEKASSEADARLDSDSAQTADLPQEARATLRLIDTGGPFPFDRDGIVFSNFERLLPQHNHSYYREYTVPTPGLHHRGARRIVTGEAGERYYTADHYRSFRRIRP